MPPCHNAATKRSVVRSVTGIQVNSIQSSGEANNCTLLCAKASIIRLLLLDCELWLVARVARVARVVLTLELQDSATAHTDDSLWDCMH